MTSSSTRFFGFKCLNAADGGLRGQRFPDRRHTMKRTSRIIFAVITVFSAMASAHAQSPREESRQVIEQAMEWQGEYGGPVDRDQEVIDNAGHWARLWRSLRQGSAPALDFTKYSAVAIMVGKRPTGGYRVEFLDPVPKGEDVIVRFRVLPPTGITTQAVTQPWKVRAFPRVAGKIYVERENGPDATLAMTRELMARLVKLARDQEKPGSISAKLCAIFLLCSGTSAMKVQLLETENPEGHYFALTPGSVDIVIIHERGSVFEAYLTDRTYRLRAAAIADATGTRLITNEEAIDKFESELALFAKEARELPPTVTGEPQPLQ